MGSTTDFDGLSVPEETRKEKDMMRKSALVGLTLLVVTLWLPAGARAELGEIRVGVDGMTCLT